MDNKRIRWNCMYHYFIYPKVQKKNYVRGVEKEYCGNQQENMCDEVCRTYFPVSLFAFDGLDILGMGEAYMDVMFEVIKNRNPVLAYGFHTNMITMVFN